MNDQVAVETVRYASPEAAARLMQTHNRRLWRLARGILRNGSDAEDVVQEVYLRAFTKLGDFRGDSSLGTWLARITINEALRRLATRRSTEQSAELDGSPAPEHYCEPFAGAPPTPEQVAARMEVRRIVEQAIDVLPAPFRLVFVMRIIEQMSIEETAAALDIHPATVKTRLHRANQQLRQTLGNELGTVLQGAFPFGGRRCDRLTREVLAKLATCAGDGHIAVHAAFG